MPYESERAYWRTLPEIVDHIGAVNGCDRDAARQQIRKALANGTLGPLPWEYRDPRRATLVAPPLIWTIRDAEIRAGLMPKLIGMPERSSNSVSDPNTGT